MCLGHKQTKREFLRRNKIQTHKNNEDVMIGWKVIRLAKSGNIYPPYYKVRGKSFKVKKQLHELNYRQGDYAKRKWLADDSAKKYKMGFHTIAIYSEALGYLRRIENEAIGGSRCYLIKVFISKYNITSYGTQCGCGTVVSDAMYIPEQNPITSRGNISKKRI
jgi:hypothetical protein